jgi:hypothetical protein
MCAETAAAYDLESRRHWCVHATIHLQMVLPGRDYSKPRSRLQQTTGGATDDGY